MNIQDGDWKYKSDVGDDKMNVENEKKRKVRDEKNGGQRLKIDRKTRKGICMIT